MLPVYNFNPDLVDPYRDLSYAYLDNPYLHLRPQSGAVRPPTPIPDTDLAFTPISQQLIYPATRRVDPNPTPDPNMLDYYAATSQPLFPTPSELLSNINHQHPSCTRDVSEPRPYMQPSPPPPQTSRQQSPAADTSTAPLSSAVNKTESQRKARQRAIADEIGFNPTDPYAFRLPLRSRS